MISPSAGDLADNVTDVVGGVLTTGKELASDAAKHLPEVTESVGKIARSSAETVANLATTAIALTPFVRGSSPSRSRRWWVAPIVVAAVFGVLVTWKRSRSTRTPVISGPEALASTTNVTDFDRPSTKTA